MKKLKPNKQRAKDALMLIWIIFALEIISIISGYFQYKLLRMITEGNAISEELASANDLREGIIGVIYGLIFILSAIAFIQWFRRAYFNLHQKMPDVIYSEGWAAGSWFVPIVNLYRPYQIMKELYHKTEIILRENGIRSKLSNNSIGSWWALWIISNIVGQIFFKYYMKAESVDELINGTVLGLINNVIGIPLALITVIIIKEYSDAESLLYEINDEEHLPELSQLQDTKTEVDG